MDQPTADTPARRCGGGGGGTELRDGGVHLGRIELIRYSDLRDKVLESGGKRKGKEKSVIEN